MLKKEKFIFDLNRETIFCFISSSLLFLALFFLRTYRLFYSIFQFNFNPLTPANIILMILSFTQDAFFCCFLLFIILFSIKHLKQKIIIPFEITVCLIFFLIFAYDFVDLLYFKSSTVSLSWENISQLNNISNLWDSGLYLMSPILIALFVAAMISFFVLPFIMTNRLYDKFSKINLNVVSLSRKAVSVSVIILVFFTVQFFMSCIHSPVEINSIPVFKLFTSFITNINSGKSASKVENMDPTLTYEIDNKILNSQTTPVSITDRKTQNMIRSKLSGIKNRKFNVVYYLSESTYAKYYPMYGNKVNVSPFLQQASMKSLLMKNMYATGVRSINSLVSILSGINGYPGYKSITYVNPRMKVRSLSEILKDRGYSNALIHSGSFDFYDKLLFLNGRGYDFLADDKYFRNKYPDIFHNSWGVDDKVATRVGLEWIDKQVKDGKNFFMTFVPILPHHPYTVPPGTELFIKNPKSLFDNYLNSLYYVDQNFELLYKGLEKRNLLDDTVIVFLADHGEAFGQHDGNYEHENNIYEENVRIPGIIFNGRLFDKYYEFEGVATNSDMYATILDILNIDNPVGSQGTSVLRMNTGKIAFFASDEKDMAIGLRDGDYKAIYNMNQNRISLYNMKESDIEKDDISKNNPDLAREYQRLLNGYFKYEKNYIENFDGLIAAYGSKNRKTASVSLLDIRPFFEVQDFYPVRNNVTADDGKPIVVNGKTYETGFGVFANSCMKFDIKNSGYKKFTGLAGKIDMWTKRENFLEMQIFVDGKKMFTTGKLNGGDDVVPFDIDVENAQVLELLVLDGGDNKSFDSAAWINPSLIK
jgi:phosphoglycerol transferase MdoB-like AlkP superfamily enzyme